MKKLLLGLGTIATVATPIITVVSCGGVKHIELSLSEKKIAAKKSIDAFGKKESKRIDDAKNGEEVKAAVERIKSDRKDVRLQTIKGVIIGLLDVNFLDIVDTIKMFSNFLPSSVSKYIKLVEFTSSVLNDGIKKALGPASGFEDKLKELFNIDLSKNEYLPLIKGFLYGFNEDILKKLDKIPSISINIGSMKLTLNIHDFISDITNKGFVYAIHNAPFYAKALEFINKLQGFDPADIHKKVKFDKYYGDVKIAADTNGVVTVNEPGFISKIFKEGILNISKELHILMQSFINDLDGAKLLPLATAVLAAISKPGGTSPFSKFLPMIFKLLKNINILSDASNDASNGEKLSLIHELITNGVGKITIPEFAKLISLIKKAVGISTELGEDNTATGTALHELLTKENKLGDMTIPDLAAIIVPIIEFLKKILGDLPDMIYMVEGAIKAAAAIYTKDTDTLKSLIPIIMLFVAKFI